jgi:hypothetical protein
MRRKVEGYAGHITISDKRTDANHITLRHLPYSRDSKLPTSRVKMQLQETILCAASPSSGISTGSLAFHDIRTGSILASFKQTSSKIHCTDVIETSNGQGGFVLTVQPEKSIMNVYNYQKASRDQFESISLTTRNIGSNGIENCVT